MNINNYVNDSASREIERTIKMKKCADCQELKETNSESKCKYHDNKDDWYYDDCK